MNWAQCGRLQMTLDITHCPGCWYWLLQPFPGLDAVLSTIC